MTSKLEKLIEEKKLSQYVYKFTSVKSDLFKLLINSNLWFASPLSFNDPFDCQLNDQTNWTEEKYRGFLTKNKQQDQHVLSDKAINKITPELFKNKFVVVKNKLLSEIGVSCFSTQFKNQLMWSHYSGGHTGVCLKFDILKDMELFKNISKVTYTNDYPKIQMQDDYEYPFKEAIHTKSKFWSYEKEIRVIKSKRGYYPFNKSSLVAIVLGCKIDSNDRDTLLNILLQEKYRHTKIFQIKKIDNKFKFTFQEEKIDRQQHL